MKNKIALTAILLGVSLSGCTSVGDYNPSDDLSANKKSALNSLVQISIEARDELRLLAKTQEAAAFESLSKEQHDQKEFQALKTLEGFRGKVDFSYDGPSTKAAHAIAKMAGYKYKQYGKPLNVFQEPWVSINIKDQPLNEALKELGMQTGKNVRIEVYEPAKLLRYVYVTIE